MIRRNNMVSMFLVKLLLIWRQFFLIKMKVFLITFSSIEHRAYDNIDLNEEKQNEIVIEEKEKTIEEKFAFREQLFFYAGLSLSVFAFAVMVDLFLLVC